jgi:riboflavin biosynthesis pyrimidine reductase
VRSLLPVPAERVNLVEAYSKSIRAPEGRPFVRVNMVSTLDGAVAFTGRSGSLGGPGDKLVFSVLRAISDVILVGAGTVRAEHYGPPTLPPDVQELREKRGQSPLPRLAVVTQSANLDPALKLFSSRGPDRPMATSLSPAPAGDWRSKGPLRPIVIAPGTAPAENLQRVAMMADVLSTGTGAVDLRAALQELGRLGARHILCEGGPRLNASLAAAGLVDELCLTLSPKLAGSVGGGLTGGWLGSGGHWMARSLGDEGQWQRRISFQPIQQLLQLELVHLLEEDSFLFLRLRARYDLAAPHE